MTMHSRKWKESQLKELQGLADEYPVIAVASLTGFPGALAKEIRKKLHGKAVVKVCKTRVVSMALMQSKANASPLNEHLKGSVAVIFSSMNPFELYAFLKKSKVSMSAYAGLVAPDDIFVPAGDTGLPPGPALSDLKAAGLKTAIQGSTIAVMEGKVVTKKGEPVSAGVAGALSKLGIKPVKVSLKVLACLEKGQVFLGNVLDIDSDKVMQDFTAAARAALGIAVEMAYFTKGTASAILAKGFRSAKAVALEANILTSATIGEILARASAEAGALKAKIPEAPFSDEKASGKTPSEALPENSAAPEADAGEKK